MPVFPRARGRGCICTGLSFTQGQAVGFIVHTGCLGVAFVAGVPRGDPHRGDGHGPVGHGPGWGARGGCPVLREGIPRGCGPPPPPGRVPEVLSPAPPAGQGRVPAASRGPAVAGEGRKEPRPGRDDERGGSRASRSQAGALPGHCGERGARGGFKGADVSFRSQAAPAQGSPPSSGRRIPELPNPQNARFWTNPNAGVREDGLGARRREAGGSAIPAGSAFALPEQRNYLIRRCKRNLL